MRLLRDAAHPSADGARVAACGPLVADGPLLAAPMTGRPCVTYKYEVTTRSSQRRLSVTCDGYALTPCHVDTPGGSIRILGYTDFRFSPETPSGPDAESRMRGYLAGTTLTPHGLTAGRAFLAMLADEDGAIRADFGTSPALDAAGFIEYAVADREEVCAFGTYSADRGGLVPGPGSVDAYPVSLRRGSAARIRRSFLTGAAGYLGLAAFLAALGAVAAWLLTRL